MNDGKGIEVRHTLSPTSPRVAARKRPHALTTKPPHPWDK